MSTSLVPAGLDRIGHAEGLPCLVDLDPVVDEQQTSRAAAHGSCCCGGMTNANGPPWRPFATGTAGHLVEA